MNRLPAVEVEQLTHRYGLRPALEDVTFAVTPGEIFGLLGPNGGGKTTIFRILATLLPPTAGCARIFGRDVSHHPLVVRRCLGVVFQSFSLDRKMTVKENLHHHGHLYGLHGRTLEIRTQEMLDRLGLADRAASRVETLSGGLQRRLEVAKGLLHEPAVLLLDEPTAGLDAGARRDLRTYLERLRVSAGVTVLLTTHLFDEAEICDRLAILDRGRLVALDAPEALKKTIGADIILLDTKEPDTLRAEIEQRFGGQPVVLDNRVRIERPRGHQFVTELVETFPGRIDAVTVAKPTLEDVFIRKTGHRFWDGEKPGTTIR